MTDSRQKKAMRLVLEAQESGTSARFRDRPQAGRRNDPEGELNHEEEIVDQLAPYLKRQAEQFPYEKVETALATNAGLDRILTAWLQRTRTAIEEPLARVLGAAAITGFKMAYSDKIEEFNLPLLPIPDEQVRLHRWARRRVAGFLDEYEQATGASIKRIIAEAQKSGAQASEILARVRAFLNGWLERAKQMAGDEATLACEQGVFVASLIMGATTKKWVTVGDTFVCPVCRGNGEEVGVAIERPFSSGHMTAPAHRNCRCLTFYEGITRVSVFRAL